jgi:hypothetical protein
MRNSKAFLAIVLAVLVVNSISVRAQEKGAETARIEGRATLTANVGMMASIQQVVFPGTELIPRQVDSRNTPVVIRIDAVYAHGDSFRYDLTWSAYEAGRHNLAKYLVRKDGTSTDGLPSLEVTASSILDPDRMAPNAPEIRSTTSVGGYRTLMWMAGVLWVVGLVALIATRKKKTASGAESTADSPQGRLDAIRKLLQLASSGRGFSAADKAKLEGLIIGFWREHKQIQHLSAQLAFAQLREDADAGPLLKQLERWLYDRPPLNDADLASLLLPLQEMVTRVHRAAGELHI